MRPGGVAKIRYHWPRLLAAALAGGSAIVFAFGRGGTMVLLGATLAFGALAAIMLSLPDGDPATEDLEEAE